LNKPFAILTKPAGSMWSKHICQTFHCGKIQ